MSLPKSEISEILSVFSNVLTRLIDCVENDALFQPHERRALLNTMYEKMCGVQMDKILNQANANHKLQLKRGNASANDAYVGLSGEITIDTDANTLRVHDGENAGGVALARTSDTIGDWVVESQLPTAENNYTWYRKYKSGWVEQGGIFDTPGKGYQSIILPVEMADTGFSAQVTRAAGTSTSAIDCWIQSPGASLSTTTLVYYVATQTGLSWFVCGIAK